MKTDAVSSPNVSAADDQLLEPEKRFLAPRKYPCGVQCPSSGLPHGRPLTVSQHTFLSCRSPEGSLLLFLSSIPSKVSTHQIVDLTVNSRSDNRREVVKFGFSPQGMM